jgi:hypothetical protein
VINLSQEDYSDLLPIEQLALDRLIEKYNQYVLQGRAAEARGVCRSIGIVFHTLKSSPESNTEWSGL